MLEVLRIPEGISSRRLQVLRLRYARVSSHEKLLDATRAYRLTVATLVQFTPDISQ